MNSKLNLFNLISSRYIIRDKIDSSNEKSYLEHRKPAWEDVEHETPLRPWCRNPPSWASSAPYLSFYKEECKKFFYAADK